MARVTSSMALQAAYDNMRRPFEWRLRRDCTVACVAFASLHGCDPLSECKAEYNSLMGASRILQSHGGYASWCSSNIHLKATSTPLVGDLVLTRSDDCFGAALGLCIEPNVFACKSLTGLSLFNADILGAWTCHL